jgi:hypothetical protein
MHTCRNCNQSFTTELALDIHKDTCADADLFCQVCGERFREGEATRDGWHYRCPNEDCDGEGREEDLFSVEDAKVPTR